MVIFCKNGSLSARNIAIFLVYTILNMQFGTLSRLQIDNYRITLNTFSI